MTVARVPSPNSSPESLSETDIHHVLRNRRRRLVLDFLRESSNETLSARELSERIAAIESNDSPAPRNVRQSVYVSLHQTHLPKLDSLGIVEYDEPAKTVSLSDQAGQLSMYFETVSKYGLSWSEYYGTVSLLGVLLVLSSESGVPIFSEISGSYWAAAIFLLIAASAAYQTVQQGSSIVRRLLKDTN